MLVLQYYELVFFYLKGVAIHVKYFDKNTFIITKRYNFKSEAVC